MQAISYLDFDLSIQALGDNNYRVKVIKSPAGEDSITFQVPFTSEELECFIQAVGGILPAGESASQDQTEIAAAFGGKLFDSVFKGPVLNLLLRSQDAADSQKKGLRILLRLNDAPQLTNLPWEYLYNTVTRKFFTLSRRTPVLRYLELPRQADSLSLKPPLRILVMISSPSDLPPLNTEKEWGNLQSALKELVDKGIVIVDRLESPTSSALLDKVRDQDYHIFHFIGHGVFDPAANDGELILQGEDGLGEHFSGEKLGVLLGDIPNLRLVVLNACEGARASSTDPFAGVAQGLVQQGVPAVVGMQFPISDSAAVCLARGFYSALASNFTVDASLAEGRREIYSRSGGIEWGTPVLFLRGQNGRIFDIPETDESVFVPPPHSDTPISAPSGIFPKPPLPPLAETGTHPISVSKPAFEKPVSSAASWLNRQEVRLGMYVLAGILVLLGLIFGISGSNRARNNAAATNTAFALAAIPTQTATPSPTSFPTSTPSPSPTSSPTPEDTRAATATETPTASPTPTDTPTPTATQNVFVGDQSIRPADLPSLVVLSNLRAPGADIHALAFHPDNERMAVATAGGVSIIRLVDGKVLHEFTGAINPTGIDFSDDGLLLAVSYANAPVVVFDVTTNDIKYKLSFSSSANCVAFSSDSTILAAGFRDSAVRAWRMSDGSVYQAYLHAHSDSVTSVQFLEGDTELVSASEDKILVYWQVRSGSRTYAYDSENAAIRHVIVAPDGERIAYVSDKNRLVMLATRSSAKTISTSIKPLVSPVFSPDGLILVAATQDNRLRFWNSLDYSAIVALPEIEGVSLQALAFSPNGYLVAAGDAKGNILLYGIP